MAVELAIYTLRTAGLLVNPHAGEFTPLGSYDGPSDSSHEAYIRGSISDQGILEEADYQVIWVSLSLLVWWEENQSSFYHLSEHFTVSAGTTYSKKEKSIHSTVSSYRSAVSISHPYIHIDGVTIGKHPIISEASTNPVLHRQGMECESSHTTHQINTSFWGE